MALLVIGLRKVVQAQEEDFAASSLSLHIFNDILHARPELKPQIAHILNAHKGEHEEPIQVEDLDCDLFVLKFLLVGH